MKKYVVLSNGHTMTMSKTYAYIRFSTVSQEEAEQRHQIDTYAQAHGMTIHGVVRDEGVSGGVSYKERNLCDLFSQMVAGDTLIVSELSRLTRGGIIELTSMVENEFKPRRMRLIIVNVGLDIDCTNLSPMVELQLAMMATFARIEKQSIQERTKAALEARKRLLEEQGKFISKQGRVVTHLGREKGCDNHRAVQASAQAKKQRAVNDENNRRIWAIIKDAETRQQKEDAARMLNFMGISLPSGLPFTYKRVCEVRNRQLRMFRKISI